VWADTEGGGGDRSPAGRVEGVDGGEVEMELHGDQRWCVERVRRVRLTDPQGFMVSNDVISSVFAHLDKHLDASAFPPP
jgi:hypothetical protein